MHRLIRGPQWTRFLLGAMLLALLPAAFSWQAARADEPYLPAGILSGMIWTAPMHVSTTSADGAFEPTLAHFANDSEVTIVYNHDIDTLNISNPHFRRSTNAGTSWASPGPVRNSALDLLQVRATYGPGGMAHAVWRTETAIHHANEGQWPAAHNVVTSGSTLVFSPDVAVGPDGIIHVVWAQGDAAQNIYHAYSSNGGSTWSAPTPLANEQEKSSVPGVAVDSQNNVHVVWEERIFDPSIPGFRFEIHYKKGTKSGSSYNWSGTPTVLSPGIDTAQRPVIIADQLRLHVAFSVPAGSDGQLPYYTQFLAGSWSTAADISNGNPVLVNTNTPFYLIAALATCGNNVHYYYHGALTVNGREQIMGKRRSYNSPYWTTLDVITSEDDRSVNPSLTCMDGKLHLAYERIITANVDHQIYYMIGEIDNSVHLPILMKP